VSSVVRWQRFRWRVDADALVIEQGLLQRQRRVIPLERIQTVDVVRRLRHRPFGVVEVHVEAIGGGSTEGQLDALAAGEARDLRARLLREAGDVAGPAGAPAPAAGAPLVRMRPGALVAAGLTGGRVGVAAALLGFGQQLFGDRVDELIERVPALVGGIRSIVLLVLLVLAVSFLLSIAVTVLVYWDFTLVRDGPNLRVRRGLLEQRLDTIPLRRVQAVRVEENILRRLFGLAAVKVDIAGRAGSDAGRDTGILLPLGRRAEAFRLAAAVLDRPEAVHTLLAAMPARARNRRLFRAGLFTVLALGAALVLWGWAGIAAAGVGAPAAWAALDAYRNLGHGRCGDVVVGSSGVLVRRTVYVPVGRLQSLALTATPFQRWRDLGTVELQIARSPGVWGGPQLIDLDATAGRRLLATLTADADRSAAEASV
jgi:putative membrane protein